MQLASVPLSGTGICECALFAVPRSTHGAAALLGVTPVTEVRLPERATNRGCVPPPIVSLVKDPERAFEPLSQTPKLWRCPSQLPEATEGLLLAPTSAATKPTHAFPRAGAQ